ncbi:MAG: hypothetical protein ACYSUF_07805 [Planctomycetota bacterium]
MADSPTGPGPREEALNMLVRSLIGPVLLVLAVWLAATRDWTGIPHTEPVHVNREDISTNPVRQPLPDPPRIMQGGYAMHCMECHRHFESRPDTPRRLMQHRHIVLDHGLNDRCLNCHDREDRNKLVLDGGRLIPYAETDMLCAQCHGTAWRDWQRGTHGRTNDYWDISRGPMRRLVCIECHDPHAPAFAPMRLLPGPNTLRMGEPSSAEHATDASNRNPLLQWSVGRSPAHAPDEASLRDVPHDDKETP